MDDLIENYLDLVAIGTIADVVPLISENRTLAKIGLKVLSRAKRPALRAIMDEACLLGKSVTSQDVAFVLAPRINSCGRLASAEELVKLLLSKKAEDVTYLANYLGKQNALRKTIENKIIDQVEDFINQNKSLVFEPIIIVFGEKWHTGIIGIVAARFVEKYGKPCIVISTEKSKARASGRSVAGFSLHEAVAHCSEFLTRFGGHPMAVGFEMKTANISKFLQKIFTFARQPEKAPQPLSLTLDCKLNPEALSLDLCDQIHKLEPFGTANPEPLFGIFNMQLTKICPVGGGKHLRLLLQKNEKELTCMKFCTSIDEFGYIEGDTVDIAFNLKESKYLGKKKISIFIRDIRFSALNTEKMLQERRTYESIYRGDCFYPLPPGFDVTRENVVSVYRYLKNCKTWTFPIETLYLRLKNEQISYLQLHYIIDIMHELDLLTLTFKNGDLHITLKNNDNKKMDLSSSRTFQKMKS
jgi:single-stranded-DNA-specific exonuclease